MKEKLAKAQNQMGHNSQQIHDFGYFYDDDYDEEAIDIDSDYSDAKSADSWDYRTNQKKPNKKGMKTSEMFIRLKQLKNLGKTVHRKNIVPLQRRGRSHQVVKDSLQDQHQVPDALVTLSLIKAK